MGNFLKSTALLILLGLNIKSQSQIPNSGFETWIVDSNNDNNPVGWTTTNDNPDVSVLQYSPAYAGNYSMKVKTFNPGFMYIGGIAEATFPYNLRPTEIKACFKTAIMPGDKVYIIVSLFKGDSIIAAPGNCSFAIDSTFTTFKCRSFPIVYTSTLTPDSAHIMIIAGSTTAQAGTEIIIDNLAFGFTSGISEMNQLSDLSFNYPNPAADFTTISIVEKNAAFAELIIYNNNGSIVFQKQHDYNKEGQNIIINTSSFNNGIYPYLIKCNNGIYSGKLVVLK